MGTNRTSGGPHWQSGQCGAMFGSCPEYVRKSLCVSVIATTTLVVLGGSRIAIGRHLNSPGGWLSGAVSTFVQADSGMADLKEPPTAVKVPTVRDTGDTSRSMKLCPQEMTQGGWVRWRLLLVRSSTHQQKRCASLKRSLTRTSWTRAATAAGHHTNSVGTVDTPVERTALHTCLVRVRLVRCAMRLNRRPEAGVGG